MHIRATTSCGFAIYSRHPLLSVFLLLLLISLPSRIDFFSVVHLPPPLSLPVIMSAREKKREGELGRRTGRRETSKGRRESHNAAARVTVSPSSLLPPNSRNVRRSAGRERELVILFFYVPVSSSFLYDSPPLPSAGPPHPHTIASSFLIHRPISWCWLFSASIGSVWVQAVGFVFSNPITHAYLSLSCWCSCQNGLNVGKNTRKDTLVMCEPKQTQYAKQRLWREPGAAPNSSAELLLCDAHVFTCFHEMWRDCCACPFSQQGWEDSKYNSFHTEAQTTPPPHTHISPLLMLIYFKLERWSVSTCQIGLFLTTRNTPFPGTHSSASATSTFNTSHE